MHRAAVLRSPTGHLSHAPVQRAAPCESPARSPSNPSTRPPPVRHARPARVRYGGAADAAGATVSRPDAPDGRAATNHPGSHPYRKMRRARPGRQPPRHVLRRPSLRSWWWPSSPASRGVYPTQPPRVSCSVPGRTSVAPVASRFVGERPVYALQLGRNGGDLQSSASRPLARHRQPCCQRRRSRALHIALRWAGCPKHTNRRAFPHTQTPAVKGTPLDESGQ